MKKQRIRKWLLRGGGSGVVLLAVLFFHCFGCVLFTPLPKPSTVEQRLATFPTEGLPIRGDVTLYWDEHMIPFIEAARDDDVAFVLGMVHAHLRLAQMELVRHVTQGRLAEMFGPVAADIDQSLRTLDLRRAIPEMLESMPEETRSWLSEFVRGVNHYQDRLDALPHEFAVLNLRREPWTVEDVLAVQRLGGADIHWLTWFQLLKIRGRPGYEDVLKKLLEGGALSVPSFAQADGPALLTSVLGGLSRSGSNSLAVSGARSATGGALLANDPHLGITVPGTWLVAGYKSPSFHVVGLMFVGAPFIAIGRNPQIAWGGTNMRASSSDLYDLSDEPAESIADREETVRVRWWLDRTVTVRESRLGPVISDIPVLEDYRGPDLALRWMGHEPSDELTAMLAANRARDWREFREAFHGYAVPGMNMLYADAKGNIGQLLAVRVPGRAKGLPADVIRDPAAPGALWRGYRGSQDLPVAYNPAQGFLVSCNNVPVRLDPPVGYFFSSSDRIVRIRELLASTERVSVDDIRAIQEDVYSPTDTALRDLLLAKVDACGLRARLKGERPELLAALEAWDGHYRTDSAGAAAFQAVAAPFARAYFTGQHGDACAQVLLRGNYALPLLRRELGGVDPGAVADALLQAFETGAPVFREYGTWGGMHRLLLAHPFQRIPLVGRRYRFGDHAAPGSSDTVYKTAHELVAGKTYTRYGSNARHVSDLSDPDANDFVLLGGQDGWLNAEASLDQVPLWQEGKTVRVPLRLDTVRRTFVHRMVLKRSSQ